MNILNQNNPSAAPADWFHHLDRMELDQAITQVVGRRHADLRLLVDKVASTIAEVDAVDCGENANWRVLRASWSEFTERLGLHLSAENRPLLSHATGKCGPPTRKIIRHIHDEHTHLLKDHDALTQSFESVKNANFCDEASAAKLARAANLFVDLESALFAEIFAEEFGILRRCTEYHQSA